MPTRLRCNPAIALILGAAFTTHLASAQVSGRLSMHKHTFAAGEPIAISFQAINRDARLAQVLVTQLYGLCGSPYEVAVDGIRCREPWQHDMAISCLYGDSPLRPGQRYRESFIIPKELRLMRNSGRHKITVSRRFSYSFGKESLSGPWLSKTFTATFKITITDGPAPSRTN